MVFSDASSKENENELFNKNFMQNSPLKTDGFELIEIKEMQIESSDKDSPYDLSLSVKHNSITSTGEIN